MFHAVPDKRISFGESTGDLVDGFRFVEMCENVHCVFLLGC